MNIAFPLKSICHCRKPPRISIILYFIFFLTMFLVNIALAQQPQLKLTDDGTFRILQITDIHYGEDDEWDRKCTGLME